MEISGAALGNSHSRVSVAVFTLIGLGLTSAYGNLCRCDFVIQVP